MGSSGAAAAYFRTAADADAYVDGRPKYPRALFDAVLSQHTGDRGVLLDLGCGPVNELAHLFETAIGIDTSEPFIASARATSIAQTRTGQAVRFEVGSAESMPMVEDASVDLLVCGIAAHWFPATWWTEAERVVKPGGSVALFTYRGDYLKWGEPHAELWRSPEGLVYHEMAAWHDPAWASFEPGNSHVKSLYETLPMPTNGRWSEPRRQKWDVEGKPSDPAHGFLCSSKLTLRQLNRRYETYSLVPKWRKDHLDLALGPEDPLVAATERIKRATGWTDDAPVLELGSAIVLVTLKRL